MRMHLKEIKSVEIQQAAYDVILCSTAASLPFEVGGILLGYKESGARAVVTHALHVPTPTRARDRYTRDDALAQRYLARFLRERDPEDKVGYIGEWHSHPASLGPSSIDREAIQQTARSAGFEVPLVVFAAHGQGHFHGLVAAAERWRRIRSVRVETPSLERRIFAELPATAVQLNRPVFISYRQSDGTERADDLERLLHAAGLPVWRDRRDLLSGNTEDRLEEALTSGLSAAVLVVSREIVKSQVVRNTELPRLLQLSAHPGFSLAIANEIPSAEDKNRPSYGAPDVLLSTDGAELGRMKQSNSRTFEGRLGLVRDLLDHRVRKLGPKIVESGRAFHITTQSRVQPSSIDAYRGDLDIRILPAEVGKLPTPKGLEDLRGTLPLISDAIRAVGASTVRVSGGMHLSVALAVGAALPETKFGRLEVLDNEQRLWSSSTSTDDPRLRTILTRTDALPTEGGERKLAVFVTLKDGADETAFQALVSADDRQFSSATFLTLDGSGLIDPRESGRLAKEIVDQIRAAARTAGTHEIHLAFQGPFTMAVLVGRLLNTFRTVVYEWQRGDGGAASYTPILALELDVARAPIAEVYIP